MVLHRHVTNSINPFLHSLKNTVNAEMQKAFLPSFLPSGGKGREKESERNINVRRKHRWVASCMRPDWGPNPQPRRVPWPGTELEAFQFARPCKPTGLYWSRQQTFTVASFARVCLMWLDYFFVRSFLGGTT